MEGCCLAVNIRDFMYTMSWSLKPNNGLHSIIKDGLLVKISQECW